MCLQKRRFLVFYDHHSDFLLEGVSIRKQSVFIYNTFNAFIGRTSKTYMRGSLGLGLKGEPKWCLFHEKRYFSLEEQIL